MNKSESAEEFFQDHQVQPEVTGQFNVFEMGKFCKEPRHYSRKNFYKISLLKSSGKVTYANMEIHINQPALMFTSPMTPYAWEHGPEEVSGHFCLFKEDFLQESKLTGSVQNSPLFKIGATPIFFLNQAELNILEELFVKMMGVIESDYLYKYELLRTYVSLVIHEAIQMRPIESSYQPKNASERITSLFLELLERQFPIESTSQALKLKSASDYAEALSIHVNHLNFSVKEITGKSTTVHITDRILAEAKLLLRQTNWPISDIAFSLGFDYPTYFNNFFKKKTGDVPTSLRT